MDIKDQAQLKVPTLKEIFVSIGKELNIPVYCAEMDSSEFKVNIPGFKINGDLGMQHYREIISSKAFNFNW